MKYRILKLLAAVSCYSGIVALFYFLNRRAKRIITFHNVLPSGLFSQDLTNGVSDSEETFRFKIAEISKRFSFSVDLLDARSVTITFDDGFLNQYEVAGEILRQEGNIPAILFVTGDVLDNSHPEQTCIVDLLLHWTALAPDGDYGDFVMTKDNRVSVWVNHIRPAYVADPRARGRNLLATLDGRWPMSKILEALPSEYKRLRLTGISSAQADELRKRGWRVGWHTKSHFPLSALTVGEMRDEIAAPQEFQKEVFSYPFGETLSVDQCAVEEVKQSGFPCAVSNIMAVASFEQRYFLPRMDLPSERHLLHFRLSGAEHFVRTGHFLPRCQVN